jgi:hypothetical protein
MGDANYANAKQSLAASVREIERLSKRRFAELMKLPASRRISHLTDPAPIQSFLRAGIR